MEETQLRIPIKLGQIGRDGEIQNYDSSVFECLNRSNSLPHWLYPATRVNMMNIEDLQALITASGGGDNALEYAQLLLAKVNRLEASGRHEKLLRQLRQARQVGDLRGRVLEVNYADQFERNGQPLDSGVKQGQQRGDIDFKWSVGGYHVFNELKLLGQDDVTKLDAAAQIQRCGVSRSAIFDDTRDVRRIQYNLMQKASTKKFNPAPESGWINLVGIDVTELQLGTVDAGDCLLAAGGNQAAAQHCHAEMVTRPNVVGVFEAPVEAMLSPGQQQWLYDVQRVEAGRPHPRGYIHGALFLFRNPKATAALSYNLSAILVWNPRLVTCNVAREITSALQNIVPGYKSQ